MRLVWKSLDKMRCLRKRSAIPFLGFLITFLLFLNLYIEDGYVLVCTRLLLPVSPDTPVAMTTWVLQGPRGRSSGRRPCFRRAGPQTSETEQTCWRSFALPTLALFKLLVFEDSMAGAPAGTVQMIYALFMAASNVGDHATLSMFVISIIER